MSISPTTSAPPNASTGPAERSLPRLPDRRRASERSGRDKRRRTGNIVVAVLLSAGAFIMLAPLAWTFSTSLKTHEAVFALPPQWIPDPAVWENYIRVWSAGPLWSGIKNSLIVACSVTVVGTVASSLAAFAFAKMRLPAKNVIFLALLTGMMIPFPTMMIPQFMMFASIGWVDTLWPLIVPGLFGNIVMIFFLKQYLDSVPDSIIEAAKLDGASFLQIFAKLIFPIIKPAMAAQFILWFMAVWNDYLAPILYLNSPENQTLQLVIASFNATYATQTDYPLIMAASFIALLPVLLVFVIFQRQIIESVALTGAKG
ncbi:multiple sugar transport system permease protein [Arthrobacter stackebrandtii]|uniref:Multiple sugar transport system permease protein n=1 Tax=Arthrobacter stackebrandtii TaxID=272161 RepID=A0ABS4Z0B0_9MICC|nr:carbohydrate ABC transporter permease [Arthrobacter stackebrandtii]MBP2414147.1 multiple sugar transport system permease protein [Arthrobacter stackebrandtii]PYG99316.1 sugar ABC transporter permease [Arthrobacter stackebrandtii]